MIEVKEIPRPKIEFRVIGDGMVSVMGRDDDGVLMEIANISGEQGGIDIYQDGHDPEKMATWTEAAVMHLHEMKIIVIDDMPEGATFNARRKEVN